MERKFEDALPIGVFKIDSANKILYLNERAKEILSLSDEDLKKGAYFNALIDAKDRKRYFAWLDKVENEEETEDEVLNFRTGGRFLGKYKINAFLSREKERNLIKGFVCDFEKEYKAIDEKNVIDERFNLLLEKIDEAFVAVDRNGVIAKANESFARIVGRDISEITNKNVYDFISENVSYEEGRSRIIALANDLLSREGSAKREVEFRGKVYEIKTYSKVADYGTAAFIRDITEEKKRLIEVLRSEEAYKSLIENALIGIAIIIDEKIVYSNASFKETFLSAGFDKADGNIFDFFEADYAKELKEYLRFILETKSSAESISLEINKEKKKWLEFRAAKIEWGKENALIAFVRDISDFKTAYQALKESETKYREIIKYAPAGVYEIDLKSGKFLSFNDAILRYTGYEKEEFAKITAFDLMTPESVEKFKKRTAKVLTGQKINPLAEFQIRRKDGKLRWISIFSNYLTDENGEPKTARVIAIDVADKKKARWELENAKRLAETIARETPILIWRIDKSGTLKFFKGQLLEALGFDDAYIIGEDFREAFEDYPDLRGAFEKIYAGETERAFFEKDGREFEIIAIREFDEQKEFVGVSGVLKTAGEEKLKDKIALERERLESALNFLAEGVFILDGNGIISFANDSAAEMSEFEKGELIGKSIFELQIEGGFSQEIIRRVVEKKEKAFAEATFRKKTGEEIAARLAISPIEGKNRGETEIICSAIDVGERIRERRETKRLKEKMESEIDKKNRLFSAVANELMNPLTVILGLTKVMSEDLNSLPIEEIESLSKAMNLASFEAMRLIDNLTVWAKKELGVLSVKFRKRILRETIGKCFSSLEKNVAFVDIKLSNNVAIDKEAYYDEDSLRTALRNILYAEIKYRETDASLNADAFDLGDAIAVAIWSGTLKPDKEFAEEVLSKGGFIDELEKFMPETILSTARDLVEINGGEIGASRNGGILIVFSLPKEKRRPGD